MEDRTHLVLYGVLQRFPAVEFASAASAGVERNRDIPAVMMFGNERARDGQRLKEKLEK